MIVLGVDPGTRHTGWGLVAVRDGVLRHLDSGVISPPPKEPLPQRLLMIYQRLVEQIDASSPEVVAVEDIFFARHPQGALKLGHARGVALLAAAQAGLPIASYPPAQVKRAISGHGRAEKGQIARLVHMLLKLQSFPQEDQADALALSICHLSSSGRLAQSRR